MARWGVTEKEVGFEKDAKGKEKLCATVQHATHSVEEVLTQKLPEWLGSLKSIKSMRFWAGSPITFARPLRWWSVAVNGKWLSIPYGEMVSSRVSYGVRKTCATRFEWEGRTCLAGVKETLAKQGILGDPKGPYS